jgi:hypothetical protein
MVSRENVNELVSIFYQKTKYKLFNVNSTNGEEFTKPFGIFISLGMTTSLKQIQDITSAISHCKGYTARVAELGSIKIGGIYLNYLTGTDPIQQYPLDEGDNKGLMNRDEVLETISQLVERSKNPETSQTELIEISSKLNKLTYLNNQLEESGGWGTHAIREDGEYKIYHLRLNYKKDPDSNIEYRIGIFVEDEQQ